MQKRPIIIALSIAGVIAGTHAGIAAINNNETTMAPAPVVTPETQAVTDTKMPGDAVAVVQTPVPAEMQPAADGVAPTSPAPATTALPTAANNAGDEYSVRIPFTSRRVKVTVPTFPQNSSEFPDTAPSVVAYFDKRNGNTQLVGAVGPVFPGGSDEFAPTQPSVIAYFDRIAAPRVAAATPAAPAPVAAVGAVPTELNTVAMAVPASAKTPGN